VLESPERLPEPHLNGDDVYNLWKDAAHVRGIMRRTPLADYLTAQPHWQTVLDYDALPVLRDNCNNGGFGKGLRSSTGA